MDFQIFRDSASIAFVRCISQISDSGVYAEGTAFTVHTAKERCRSEVIERTFIRSLPERTQRTILGIAAHPEARRASENAWCETLETLFLEAIRAGAKPSGLTLSLPLGTTLFLSRIDGRWIALLRFPHHGRLGLAQAVSTRLSSSLLKAWGERRNLQLYRPAPSRLSTYTRGNRILGDRIDSLCLTPGLKRIRVSKNLFSEHTTHDGSHFVTYFTKPEDSR